MKIKKGSLEDIKDVQYSEKIYELEATIQVFGEIISRHKNEIQRLAIKINELRKEVAEIKKEDASG